MAGKSRTLTVKVVGDTAQFEKKMKGMSAGMKVAGAAAAGALAVGLKQSVSAAIEAEKSAAKLEAQLKASNISYKAHAKEIDAVIQKHSRLAGVDDEELSDAFTTLVRSTGSVNVAMKDLGMVTDLARARNIDVAKAATMVAKVHAGAVTPLKAMGIAFTKTTENVDGLKAAHDKITPAQLAAAKAADKEANAQRALGEVQDAVKGQAEAYGETTAGAADRARVGFENLQEVVGSKLAPVRAKVANKFAELAAWAERNPAAFKAVAIAVGGLVTALAGLSIIGKVTAGLVALRKAVLLLNTAFIANPIGLAVAALVALGAGLVIAYQKSETFRRGVDRVFGFLKKVAVEAVQAVIGVIDKLMGAWSTMLSALGKVPVIGAPFRRAAASIDGAREKLRAFSASLDEIPRIKDLEVRVNAKIPRSLRKLLDDPDAPGLTLTRATGGMVPGAGRGDIVPAMLEPGEFVIRRKVVEKFGPTYFANINDGRVPGMMSGGQVADLARRAGFSGSSLVTALAVAKGESGWNENAVNASNTDGSTDRGLWQINSVHGSLSTLDPMANARAAFRISSGGRNWAPWVVFQKGLHRQYLNEARRFAVGSRGGGSVASGGASSLTPSRPSLTSSKGTSGGGASTARGIHDLDPVRGTASDLDLRLAQSDAALAVAEGTATSLDDIDALKAAKGAQETRLQKIDRALKGPLTTGTRTRLTSERASLIRGIRENADRIGELSKGPTPGEYAERDVAEASLTASLHDDLSTAGALFGIRRSELEAARGTGDPAKVIEAINNLKAAGDNLKAAGDAFKVQWVEGIEKRLGDLDAQGVIARVDTPLDFTDDLAALNGSLGVATQAYNEAKAAGDSANISRFGSDVLSLRDSIKSLTGAVEENTSRSDELKASIDAQLAFGNQVSAITSFQAVRALSDMISGHITGWGVTGRAMTIGNGALARY